MFKTIKQLLAITVAKNFGYKIIWFSQIILYIINGIY